MGNPRMVLLVALAFITLLMWQEWQKDYGPKPPQTTPPVVSQDASQLPADTSPVTTTTESEELPSLSATSTLNELSPEVADQPEKQKTAEKEKYVQVITDKLHVWIDTLGGEISKVDLRAYPVALDKPDVPFSLLEKTAGEVYVAQSGLLSRQGAPNHLAQFMADQYRYQLVEGKDTLQVPLYWTGENGVKVTKTLKFTRGTHVIDLQQKVENSSSETWQGRQYRQLVRTEPNISGGFTSTEAYTFNGAAYYSEEDKFEKIDFDDIQSDPISKDVNGGWIGMIQHYFLSAWIPDQSETNNFYTKMIRGGLYRIGMISPRIILV